MFFAQSQSECRVHSQVFGVITVLISCHNLIDSLAQQLEQGVIRMAMRSWVINLRGCNIQDVEALIDLPHDKKTRIGGDLRTLKIDADGPVETRP
jgi:hypothetical protein